MPRPKRTKVASTAARVAKSSKPAEPPVTTQKQPKSRNTATPKPADGAGEGSDALVGKSTRTRKRASQSQSQSQAQDKAYPTMNSASPVAREPDTTVSASMHRTPPHTSRRTRVSRGSAEQPSTKKTSTPAHKVTSYLEMEEGDSSGFGDHMLSFTSLDSNSPAHGTRPPSAIKVGATPAHERSILALTNFKRRARQPSLLRMVHQTTDLEDNDGEDMDLYADDLDDFHPNAESTPLPKQQTAPGQDGATDSGVNLSSSGSRGTKRKLSPVIQVPRSSPPYDPPSGPDVESRSPSPSLPDVVRGTIENDDDESEDQAAAQSEPEPEPCSDIMAPPMSSSDYAVDAVEDVQDSPVVRKGRRKRGAPAEEGEEEGQREPTVNVKAKGKQKPKAEKGISTAKLQALLPKRRTRRNPDDSDSASPLDSDEDELSMPPRRHAQLARKMAASNPSKKPGRAGRKATAPRGSRTYGRAVSSDKENEGRAKADGESDEEGSGHTEIANEGRSADLQAMAKKFEDIDAFDLDFESVSYVQMSSSPRR